MTNTTKVLLGMWVFGIVGTFTLSAVNELVSIPSTDVPVFPISISSPSEKSIKEELTQDVEQNCHPSYSGCLNPNASDYDCAGGSGNGPYYTGPVRVIGQDMFGLDRDGDGWGCE